MGVRFVFYPALSIDPPWELEVGSWKLEGMWLASRSCAARRRPGVAAVVVAAAWPHGPASVRRPPGPLRTGAALSAVGDRRASVDDHWAGLPVTQCRPWPAEDVWSEPRAAPLCARARENGRSDSPRRVRAQRSVRCGQPQAHRPQRIGRRSASLTRRARERSEGMSGARFPARGSRPRTDKAGAASAAVQARGTARDLREETRQSDTLGVN
jgi:hypothetical protein